MSPLSAWVNWKSVNDGYSPGPASLKITAAPIGVAKVEFVSLQGGPGGVVEQARPRCALPAPPVPVGQETDVKVSGAAKLKSGKTGAGLPDGSQS